MLVETLAIQRLFLFANHKNYLVGAKFILTRILSPEEYKSLYLSVYWQGKNLICLMIETPFHNKHHWKYPLWWCRERKRVIWHYLRYTRFTTMLLLLSSFIIFMREIQPSKLLFFLHHHIYTYSCYVFHTHTAWTIIATTYIHTLYTSATYITISYLYILVWHNDFLYFICCVCNLEQYLPFIYWWWYSPGVEFESNKKAIEM
jgi:hypothetical protein